MSAGVAAAAARVGALGALLLASAGCTTVTPLQTASVVEPGTYRVGAQVTTAAFCSVTADPLDDCAYIPNGFPTPELRASGRRGLPHGFDVGASLATSAVVPRGVQFGAMLDGKKELWSRELGKGRRHLVSGTLGVGVTTSQQGLFFAERRSALWELEVPVALWYGYQSGSMEYVASPRFVERITFLDLDGNGTIEALDTGRFGLSLGVFWRGTVTFGLVLDYVAPTGAPAGGLFTLSGGVLWDLGSAPAPADVGQATN